MLRQTLKNSLLRTALIIIPFLLEMALDRSIYSPHSSIHLVFHPFLLCSLARGAELLKCFDIGLDSNYGLFSFALVR